MRNAAIPWIRQLQRVLQVIAVISIFLTQAQSMGGVDLPFGDINVLVLTDVHSWVGGHSNVDPSQRVDYGVVLSFYQRLRAHCQQNKMDLWFVVNGDWIDGQGIAMNSDISSLIPVLEKMPWDALNVGNHEIYKDDVVHQFMKPGGFVEWWGDRYISSNVLHTQRQQPLGKRYRFLRGLNSSVLTFGFLYNMEDASSVVTVERVEKIVEEQWFTDVITNANKDPAGDYDAILIMAHMDVRDDLVTILLNKIRSLVDDNMPVQFLTGHTHYRGVETLDSGSVSFEAGKYLDTIGFVSFPKKKTFLKASSNRLLQDNEEEEGEGDESTPLLGPGGTEFANASESGNITLSIEDLASTSASTFSSTNSPAVTTISPTVTTLGTANETLTTAAPTTTPLSTMLPTSAALSLFKHKFIDTTVANLESIVGVSDMSTQDGTALSEFILRTRRELGLLEVVGCSTKSYFLNRSVSEDDSLWRLFLDTVAPYDLLRSPSKNSSRLFLGGASTFRFDLLEQELIRDDVIAVAPFNDTLISVGPHVPGSVIVKLIDYLNAAPNEFNAKWENYYTAPPADQIKADQSYEILTPSFGLQAVIDGLNQVGYNSTVEKKPSGYSDTEVWLKFVVDNWECPKDTEPPTTSAPGSGGSHHHNSNNHHSGGSSASSGHGRGTHPPYPAPDNEEDKLRQVLAGIGVGLVVLLGSLYIWQLHRGWLERYRERQRLIFIADSENDDNELI